MPYVFDALLLAVPLFLILRGFRRGFARAVMSLVRLAVALALAIGLAPVLTSRWNPPLAAPVAYILLFAAGFVGMTLVGRTLVRFIRASRLSRLDRLLGALAGAAGGGVCCLVLSDALTALLGTLGRSDWIAASILLQ